MDSQKGIRLLLLEDNADDAELLLLQLSNDGPPVTAVIESTREGYCAALRRQWDIVIADYMLPQFDAAEALTLLQQSDNDCPFITVSGAIGEEAAVELMRNGAADCISKANLGRLLPAMERALQEQKNRHARRLAERELQRLAYFDEVTDLPNRRYFARELHHWLNVNDGDTCYVLCASAERLGVIADTLGQETADGLGREVAVRLRQLLPKDSLLCYFGNGVFVAAFRGQMAPEHTADDVHRLMRRLALPYQLEQREFYVNPLAGICLLAPGDTDAGAVMRRVKMALVQAREHGAPFEFYDRSIEQTMVRRVLISQQLRGALQRDEFTVCYQPKVEMDGGLICGMEALLRWHDAELGAVPPDQFIPVAEECGAIISVGHWVIREVCRQMRQWRDADLPPLRVAVNVSVHQLRDPGFATGVRQALRDARLPAAALELELTESDLMTDTDAAIALLADLRALGVTITVDDFGTGYSSLSYLKRLPISTLKIDRSFIVDMVDDADSRAIVGAVIALAHSLRLGTVAEGVETRAQVDLLRTLGCDEAQGFLFSRPLTVEGTTKLLADLATDERTLPPQYAVAPGGA